MPKKAKELSALEVKRLTEPGFHFVGEVPGLALQVLPTGGRTWVLRTMIGTKRRDMGLGGFPEVTLADARSKAREARQKIKDGIDPIAQSQVVRSALRAADAVVLTFRDAASRYIEAHRPSWSNEKHLADWSSSLEQYVHPHIGSLNVADIRIAHVLTVLEQPVPVDRKAKQTGKFWECRTETASRVRGRIEVILDWCKGRGHRSGDNPAAWKGNLDAQLPKPERVHRVAHYPAVQLDQMGAFMTDLRQREGITARALEFAVLCAARSGEVRGMRWGEIDAATGVWTVPADRMKAKKEHRVPLSKPALELLAGLPRIEGNGLVFPAPRGGELSDMGLNAIMRRMDYLDRDGRKAVPHGCRSTFRDWVAERTNYPRDLAEMALAHTIGNQVEAAYRRGDMMEKRRSMMKAWADFCAEVRNDNVVGIGHKKTAA